LIHLVLAVATPIASHLKNVRQRQLHHPKQAQKIAHRKSKRQIPFTRCPINGSQNATYRPHQRPQRKYEQSHDADDHLDQRYRGLSIIPNIRIHCLTYSPRLKPIICSKCSR
jgi:hypothetical protein